MSDLFIPDEVKKRDINYLLDNRIVKEWDAEDDILVYSVYSHIYLRADMGSPAVNLKDRSNNTIWALAYHEGKVYDGCTDGVIRNTLNNFEVAKRADRIMSLCSYKDSLYDSGDYKRVYDSFSDNEISKKTVYGACVHKKNLYNLCFDGKVYEGLTNDFVTHVGSKGLSLHSFEDILYAGTSEGVVDVFSGEVVCERVCSVTNLFSFKGILYDCDSNDNLRETFSGRRIDNFCPTATTVVPKKFLEDLDNGIIFA